MESHLISQPRDQLSNDPVVSQPTNFDDTSVPSAPEPSSSPESLESGPAAPAKNPISRDKMTELVDQTMPDPLRKMMLPVADALKGSLVSAGRSLDWLSSSGSLPQDSLVQISSQGSTLVPTQWEVRDGYSVKPVLVDNTFRPPKASSVVKSTYHIDVIWDEYSKPNVTLAPNWITMSGTVKAGDVRGDSMAWKSHFADRLRETLAEGNERSGQGIYNRADVVLGSLLYDRTRAAAPAREILYGSFKGYQKTAASDLVAVLQKKPVRPSQVVEVAKGVLSYIPERYVLLTVAAACSHVDPTSQAVLSSFWNVASNGFRWVRRVAYAAASSVRPEVSRAISDVISDLSRWGQSQAQKAVAAAYDALNPDEVGPFFSAWCSQLNVDPDKSQEEQGFEEIDDEGKVVFLPWNSAIDMVDGTLAPSGSEKWEVLEGSKAYVATPDDYRHSGGLAGFFQLCSGKIYTRAGDARDSVLSQSTLEKTKTSFVFVPTKTKNNSVTNAIWSNLALGVAIDAESLMMDVASRAAKLPRGFTIGDMTFGARLYSDFFAAVSLPDKSVTNWWIVDDSVHTNRSFTRSIYSGDVLGSLLHVSSLCMSTQPGYRVFERTNCVPVARLRSASRAMTLALFHIVDSVGQALSLPRRGLFSHEPSDVIRFDSLCDLIYRLQRCEDLASTGIYDSYGAGNSTPFDEGSRARDLIASGSEVEIMRRIPAAERCGFISMGGDPSKITDTHAAQSNQYYQPQSVQDWISFWACKVEQTLSVFRIGLNGPETIFVSVVEPWNLEAYPLSFYAPPLPVYSGGVSTTKIARGAGFVGDRPLALRVASGGSQETIRKDIVGGMILPSF